MPEVPTQAQGIELKLDDGTVIKAENAEEALKIAVKMKVDTAAALKQERAEREQLQARISGLEADVARRAAPPVDQNAFNRDNYYRLVGEDPIAAQNYLDAHRFGIQNPAEVPNYFVGMNNAVTQMQQEALGANFVNVHPDFPASAETAELLTKEVSRLRLEGHPVNMNTLEIAYQNCLSNGTIKAVEEPEAPEAPNPSLGGSGAAGLDSEAQRIEADVLSGKMSSADFEKYLRSKGMLS